MATTGSVTYQSIDVPRSLVSTGCIYVNRMISGNDEPPVGISPDPVIITVFNGRDSNYTLDKNGFSFVSDQIPDIDFYDEAHLLNQYYDHCCKLVKRFTGASKVYAFDHNIRVSAKKSWLNEPDGSKVDYKIKEIKGGSEVQSPATVVHNDYTLTSAPRRLIQLADKPKLNDALRKVLGETPLIPPGEVEDIFATGRRYVFINVWRNIANTPVEDMPLALCDATTIAAEDLSTFEIRYADRVGENYFACHRPEHKWVYYPKITRDEAILLKVWDSHGNIAPRCNTNGNNNIVHDDLSPEVASASQEVTSEDIATFSFHSAFKDTQASPDCAPRESIECRLIAIY